MRQAEVLPILAPWHIQYWEPYTEYHTITVQCVLFVCLQNHLFPGIAKICTIVKKFILYWKRKKCLFNALDSNELLKNWLVRAPVGAWLLPHHVANKRVWFAVSFYISDLSWRGTNPALTKGNQACDWHNPGHVFHIPNYNRLNKTQVLWCPINPRSVVLKPAVV